MTPEDLAKMLSEMYAKGSKSREKYPWSNCSVLSMQEKLSSVVFHLQLLPVMAQIPPSYGIDINSGKKLSKYVRVI